MQYPYPNPQSLQQERSHTRREQQIQQPIMTPDEPILGSIEDDTSPDPILANIEMESSGDEGNTEVQVSVS